MNQEAIFSALAARHYFVSEIERINKKIAELEKGSNNSPQEDTTRRVTKLQSEMRFLREQIKALSENVPVHLGKVNALSGSKTQSRVRA